jgi:plasmid stabilization system protein ParE
MALEIKLSIKESLSFDQIQNYIEKEFGKLSAIKFTKNTFDFLDLLSKFPSIGFIENEKYKIRSFVIHKNTSLIYRIKNGKILLVKFHVNQQNPKFKLK